MLSPTVARTFQKADGFLKGMDADSVATLASAAADLTLLIDEDGKVHDLAFSNTDLAGEAVDAWIGRSLRVVVTDDSVGKVDAMFRETANGGSSRRREINFLGDEGNSLPVNCVAVRLDEDGRSVIFGRDMRGLAKLQQRLVNTQISMEREYTKLRQAEACYRLLFQLVGEAVLIVDANTMTVDDANPVAAELLDVPVAKIVGRRITHVFGAKDRDAVRAVLGSAQSLGKAEINDIAHDRFEAGLDAKVSLFRQADVAYFLIRLLPRGEGALPGVASQGGDVLEVIERLPEGFVIIDQQRRLKQVNTAFLELVQAASFEQVRDQPIDTWFERSSVDATVLVENTREHGQVRRFPTVLRGELGGSEPVEITSVSVPDADGQVYGLVLRRATRTPAEDTPINGFPAQSVEQLTDLIGHMSLKEVVRETTDVVERLCIEAALKLTGDNRASAAQMLGVSRQSLYAKMHRFSLGDLTSGDNDS
ncbi:MAG: transcriptional regulator PpsR [Pseudomonadota bacterium]